MLLEDYHISVLLWLPFSCFPGEWIGGLLSFIFIVVYDEVVSNILRVCYPIVFLPHHTLFSFVRGNSIGFISNNLSM
jgi:hypothetical protein